MSYLILGSDGLIGKSFASYLEQKSKKVYRWDIKMGADFDLRNPNNLKKLHKYVHDADYILFAAYDIGGAKFLENASIDILSNNMHIMLNVFSVLEIYKKPFIFLSSQMSNLLDNDYGTSKRIGEFFTKFHSGINVRLWNVYGHEDISIKSHVIPDFIDMALLNNKITMRTNGEEKRQFVYDSDCAEALYILFDNYNEFKSTNVDLATGVWTSIVDISIIIQKLMDNIVIIPGKKTDTIQKIREPNLKLLKYWTPKISLEQGISSIIKKHTINSNLNTLFSKNK
jgi:nucleoside-diphosphate-sugar epimerase